MITSREGLRISGEREYPVPPLALPDLTQLPSLESLSQFAAVELFIQRAQAVKPDFKITNDTAPAVAEICYRLDGLPLAIELAAARIKLLPPNAMLARLEHRLEFLTGGARDLPARQQTLRNTIAWSYDLLNENEQKLFRRLSVFVGGCTLDAVEAVAGDNPARASILDQLGSLLDKSLLREVEGTNSEPRFVMLEMLREFGLEQLEASGEQDTIRRRHANFFLSLAEQAGASLESAEQVQWMNRMEQEHDNLRAALEWSKTADGAGEICLRLAGTLGLFWEARGYFSEGRERLSAVLLTDSCPGTDGCTVPGCLPGRQSLPTGKAIIPRPPPSPERVWQFTAKLETGKGLPPRSSSLEMQLRRWVIMRLRQGFWKKRWRFGAELEDKHGIARALISLGWTALRSGDYHLANVAAGGSISLIPRIRGYKEDRL